MTGVAWGWPHEGQAGPSSQQEDGEMLMEGSHGMQLRCRAMLPLPGPSFQGRCCLLGDCIHAGRCIQVTLWVHCERRRRTWLKQTHVQGLGTCTGAISTAQLGTGNLLSHGNLPAHGGVIKRLSPFPSQLRASLPCQGSLSILLAPAAAGLALAYPARGISNLAWC